MSVFRRNIDRQPARVPPGSTPVTAVPGSPSGGENTALETLFVLVRRHRIPVLRFKLSQQSDHSSSTSRQYTMGLLDKPSEHAELVELRERVSSLEQQLSRLLACQSSSAGPSGTSPAGETHITRVPATFWPAVAKANCRSCTCLFKRQPLSLSSPCQRLLPWVQHASSCTRLWHPQKWMHLAFALEDR